MGAETEASDERSGCLFFLALLALVPVAAYFVVYELPPVKDQIAALEEDRMAAERQGRFAEAESIARAIAARRQEARVDRTDGAAAASRGRQGGAKDAANAYPPWPVLAGLALATVVLPAGILAWVAWAMRRGQRVWRCPVCKSLAPFLHSCSICGCEVPGLRSLAGILLAALGIVVLGALFLVILLSV